MADGSLRVKFLWTWALLLLAKLVLAARLPAMTDEAFYAWEARHLAWAYSDLPGLTAWLIRLAMETLGDSLLAIRLPFLLLGAALPWLVLRIAGRWFGAEAGLWAGLLCLLMPLSGLLGLLAVPDVALVFASLACLDAIASLRERVSWPALVWLAFGLALGALAHYRFAMVLWAGAFGLLLDSRARRLLIDARFLAALAVGVLAWWPLLQWNLDNAGTGLRFQLLDRHPWAWDSHGLHWFWKQALLATPLLFAALLWAMHRAWKRGREEPAGPWRLLSGVGGVAVWAWCAAAFFADRERVSFHWPLAGWLVWIVVLSAWLPAAARGLRIAITASTGAGLLLALAYLWAASIPVVRTASAGDRWYPDSFAGTREIVAEVQGLRLPMGTVLVADNFALAAQLALAMPEREVHALDHPLNTKHGRSRQLELWGLQLRERKDLGHRPALLVVDDSAIIPAQRPSTYRRYCKVMGGLSPARTLDVDHGRRRYLLHAYAAGESTGACVLPAMAWIDIPGKDAELSAASMPVSGWAFKDGTGLDRIEILVDGQVLAQARYGRPMPHVADYWPEVKDPAMPRVGFQAGIDLQALPEGAHWLALRVHGRDGGIEDLPAQRFYTRH